MSKSALDWVLDSMAPASARNAREPLDSAVFAAPAARVTLLRDRTEADTLRSGAGRAVAAGGDARFDAFERPTRLLRDVGALAPRSGAAAARGPWVSDLELGVDVEFFSGVTGDIAGGGVLVTTYQSIPLGTRLVVRFELPGGAVAETPGEVRWVRREAGGEGRPGIAIAFVGLPPVARESIRSLVESLPPRRFET